MKGLFKRRSTWWVRFTPVPGSPQMRIALGTDNESDAIIKAREIIARAETQVREEMESCETEIAGYISSKRRDGLSESTLSSRRYILRSVANFIGAASPRHMTSAGIRKWFESRKAINPHTAVAYLYVVHLWFKWMIERGKIATDVTTSVKVPKLVMRQRRNFLTQAEARLLLDECHNEGLKFAIYCGLHAGLRKLEIIEARPGWFDMEAGLLHVQATPTFQPKDRDNRTIPLTEEFRTWLSAYGLRKPFMLEPNIVKGSYRYRYDFRKAFDSLAKRCGFDWLTFHDLRRTFASLHVSRGTSVYKVARWLGDGVDVVEQHYGHLIPQDHEINGAWETSSRHQKTAR
ncbi:tyrosine-type recombinase/integrase [Prosthecobacter sp.]|jgi:integrase|uniref:tyrosine-type recombinase/integrase n=1 Tax=Prosthecobacter sp. TaxID=1965333 RepID=UPI003784CE57